MGCVSSKKALSVTPAIESSGAFRDCDASDFILSTSLRRQSGYAHQESTSTTTATTTTVAGAEPTTTTETATKKKKRDPESEEEGKDNSDKSRKDQSAKLPSYRLGNIQRYIEGEQVAAGWPSWLSAVAGEAIHGWIPLKPESFEKLEKVGQGTYSNVFRARNFDNGKIYALKKVRFDNFEPESVRFMAREIQILRRLDHPNVIKLEGLIASRLSCSLYLVFEYLEHDLAGLSASPDIKLSETQIKCYMHQLLSGLEHCHSRGVMHRDIKGANLLVSNEGIVKMADFGLANFWDPGYKLPLTSRVVTLWYRPPELLLGSTHYEATVDLWSVGCVFAEMFTGKPILQGRTEVEQLHKIFKLCGSPSEEYWKKSKLPHATIFKPHHPYESSLHETFRHLSPDTVNLLETLLSVEPYKRASASSALDSEYFKSKPYACDPSTLPKYPPTKEIDIKNREEQQRRRARAQGSEATRKQSRTFKVPRESTALSKGCDSQEETKINPNRVNVNYAKQRSSRMRETSMIVDPQPKGTSKLQDQGRHVRRESQDVSLSGPLPVSASSRFAWSKGQKEDPTLVRCHRRHGSQSHISDATDSSNVARAKVNLNSKRQENGEVHGVSADSKSYQLNDLTKRAILQKWANIERTDSLSPSNVRHSQDLSGPLCEVGPRISTEHKTFDYADHGERVEFSGPLLSQTRKVDELLQKHERHIRQAVRRSWFRRVTGSKQQH